MKKNTSDRLKQIMNEKNIKQVDILNMSLPYQTELDIKLSKSALSQYVNGVQLPDQHRIYLLSKTLNVSEPWLMGYDVPKDRMSDIDRQSDGTVKHKLLSVYDELNLDNQFNVYKYAMNRLEEQNNSNIVQLSENMECIEVVQKIAAGRENFGVVDLDSTATYSVPVTKNTVPEKYDYAFEVSGNSMKPIFNDGEIVFVTKQEAYDGMLGVVILDGQAFVKKIYLNGNEIRLVSMNKEYDDIIVTNKNDIEIVGKICL